MTLTRRGGFSGSGLAISLMDEADDARGDFEDGTVSVGGSVAAESGAMGTRGVDVPDGEGVTKDDEEGV